MVPKEHIKDEEITHAIQKFGLFALEGKYQRKSSYASTEPSKMPTNLALVSRENKMKSEFPLGKTDYLEISYH